jgi:Na(+)-translocating NADH:ubiquinone oxidoreductase A subunit
MRFKGGYNVLLHGRPDSTVKVMPEQKTLYLPLWSRRFRFNDLRVEEGQHVGAGDALARDLENHGVPLLAPRAGHVRLNAVQDHLVLEDIAKEQEHADVDEREIQHISRRLGSAGIKRYKLLMLGAWQFLYDAYTGVLPDPLGTPQALIVSTVSLEPFTARGDAQLHTRLLNFTRGLEQLQSLLEYQPIYLVVPNIKSEFADLIRNHIRGYAWVKMVEIPLTYPYDDFAVLARALELPRNKGPVWAMRTEGVLAIDRALTLSKPCLVRVISVGGTGVVSPSHIKVMTGYPLQAIIDKHVFEHTPRVIDGGIMTGEALGTQSLGVGAECRGITVLSEPKGREFLGFVRPGSDRGSYSACFLSALMKKFSERLKTATRGEGRPCISCNFCEEVCPAGLMPHMVHKYMHRDLLEETSRAGVDLCVSCGLCSYVCPSKIDLHAQFMEARRLIEEEKREIAESKSHSEAVKEVAA